MAKIKQTMKTSVKTVKKPEPKPKAEKPKKETKPRKKPQPGVLKNDTLQLAKHVERLMEIMNIKGKVTTNPSDIPENKPHDCGYANTYKKLTDVDKHFSTEILPNIMNAKPKLVFVEVERLANGKFHAKTRF